MENCSKRVTRSASKNAKKVNNSADKTTQIQTSNAEPEPELEQVDQTQEKDEKINVKSSDMLLHDSNFDFMQIKSNSDFSLLTPSPRKRSLRKSVDVEESMTEPLASPQLSSCESSGSCSPSKFFKSPIRTSTRASKASKRRTRQQTTSKRLVEVMTTLNQQEEKKVSSLTSVNAASDESKKTASLATSPRTSTPPIKQQHGLSSWSEDRFEGTVDDEKSANVWKSITSPSEKTYCSDNAASSLDADDLRCAPSGLLSSPGEHDSFFSFVNILSPLIPALEFDNSFRSVKLSPLMSLASNELPRLLPPFPNPEAEEGHQRLDPLAHHGTPKNTPSRKRRMFSSGSVAYDGTSTPDWVSPCLFDTSFPNIQASTSATPGKDERSKLGSHSVMKMTLHTSFGTSQSALDSHPTREIRAINNSLKRKKYIRTRKAKEDKAQTPPSSNVQRKLLQTPIRQVPLSRRVTRSPLQPWNGQTTSQTNVLKTPTSRKVAWKEQEVKFAADPTPMQVARKLIPVTDPIPVPTTPIGNKRKRKASHCASMLSVVPKTMPKSSLDAARQAVNTPAKQLKRSMTEDKGLTPHLTVTGGAKTLESSLLNPQTIAFKGRLDDAVVVLPSQIAKKAPCNCKKSKCLKLYCECFRLGGYCDKSCNCRDCANTMETEEKRQRAIASRLEKNPNAFKPKIGATSAASTSTSHRLSGVASSGCHVSFASLVSPQEQLKFQQQKTTTKMHQHGCHCKKSACQKKYCECYQAGVPCGDNCRCIDCKNQALALGNKTPTRGVTTGETPTRVAYELDETFVSPVLENIRRRLRLDREIWKKDLLTPFEASSKRESERIKQLKSRFPGASGSSFETKAMMSLSSPQIKRDVGSMRLCGMSPISGQGEEQRETHNEAASSLLSSKKQHAVADKMNHSVDKTSFSALVRSFGGINRVFVLPLFGSKLPPLQLHVSARIFGFLTNSDLHNASFVSHLWNQVALGDMVWDHANLIPTEEYAARCRKKRKLTMIETDVVDYKTQTEKLMEMKREANLAVLSTLR